MPSLLSAGADQYLVVDTNIILLQIDLLAHTGDGALTNVIIPQTVLEEVPLNLIVVFVAISSMWASLVVSSKRSSTEMRWYTSV